MFFILSKKNEEIAERILNDLDRGVTFLKSRGGYLKQEGELLFCAVRRFEVFRISEIIREIDPDAFIIVGDAARSPARASSRCAPTTARSGRSCIPCGKNAMRRPARSMRNRRKRKKQTANDRLLFRVSAQRQFWLFCSVLFLPLLLEEF